MSTKARQDSDRYHSKKISGLCVICGKIPAEPSKVKCEACRWRGNAITWLSRKSNVEKGKCSVCSNLRNDHHTLCDLHLEKRRGISARVNRKLKLEVLIAYGGPVCVCCGEEEVAFLTLDHVNNDGWKERKEQGRLRYVAYTRLKKEGYPNNPPLQVLCYNCNNGKRGNRGICPHQERLMAAAVAV